MTMTSKRGFVAQLLALTGFFFWFYVFALVLGRLLALIGL